MIRRHIWSLAVQDLVACLLHWSPAWSCQDPRGDSAGQTRGGTMRTGVDFDVSDEQRRRLEAIAGGGNSKAEHARRARIVLPADDGLGTMAVMAETGSAKATDPALAGAVHAGGRGRPSARQDAPAGQAPDVRGEGPRGGGSGAELRAGGGDALDGARPGGNGRPLAVDRAQDLRPPPARAAQGAAVQGVDRSALRGEDPRSHRVVS